MFRCAIVPALALGLVATCSVQATETHAHPHLQCSYDSDFDVQVEPAGIAFTRDNGRPGDVFMHDGQLRVDGKTMVVSAADAERLRDYERQVRALLPAMAELARDGVAIGYAAMTTVVATLDDNGDERTRLQQELRDRHRDALRQIDTTLGRGVWNAGDIDRAFGNNLQDTVADLAGSLTRDVLKDTLSGDPAKWAALEARADSLDATIDKAIVAPADKLAQRAEALCPRFDALERLQQQFQFRLATGEHLQLLTPDMDHNHKASQYAQR
ncbi:DUF2884 family protein [Dyella jejuensis]|uniref:DUF2884 family protein n=1 Tax=Dyella jejuensis TaxID=1432009 RepID=A0ABW8JG68_9GAMM